MHYYFLRYVLTKNFLQEIMFKELRKEVAFNTGKIGKDLEVIIRLNQK